MKLIIKKSFIIFIFIVFLTPINNSYSIESENKIEDYGVITFMYHRFNENKYPSTNIQVKDFKEQLQIIKDNKINFINPKQFGLSLKSEKKKKKVLLTIDDAFLSFYQNAWPILKKEKIPFILFVSTREVGSFNYMNWDQIREIADEDFVHIGNHSHSHEYLVDYDSADIINDIKKSISILKEEIGYNSEFFSYPFGEYSFEFKKIVEDLNFKYAFGQHSGVADETKDLLELPRFPINEKYGKVERFKKLLFTLPFKYKAIFPIDKYIDNSNNPPKVIIDFIDNIKDLKKMNCYSNEENEWRKSKITFVTDSQVEIKLMGKFTTERGRINCSLQDFGKYWRWLGIQFVILEN